MQKSVIFGRLFIPFKAAILHFSCFNFSQNVPVRREQNKEFANSIP
jgi:hypothetical protein